MDIGVHCAKSDCQQVDFLPFKCDCCASVFCLDHRSYDSHGCPLAGSRDRRVMECPLCKRMIRWTLEQDVNLVWEQHVHSGQCVASTASTTTTVGANGELTTLKKKKSRCGAEKCREVLLSSNQFHCTKCGLDVCLRHRFDNDHDCEGVRQRRRQQQRGSLFARAPQAAPTTTRKAASSTNTTTTGKQLEQNARAAATSIANGTRSAMNTIVQKGKAVGVATSAAVTSTSEECPICQQKFAYVTQLLTHVNRNHPEIDTRAQSSQTRSSSTSAAAPMAAPGAIGREVCPQCRTVFRDVTSLINHVEIAHSTAQATAAAGGGASGSAANGDEKCSMM